MTLTILIIFTLYQFKAYSVSLWCVTSLNRIVDPSNELNEAMHMEPFNLKNVLISFNKLMVAMAEPNLDCELKQDVRPIPITNELATSDRCKRTIFSIRSFFRELAEELKDFHLKWFKKNSVKVTNMLNSFRSDCSR